MEAVFDWVKSIVFYLILLTVVTHLLPNKKYEKYLRLFTGMLLVMVVIKPVTQVFSWDKLFDRNFLEILGDSGELGWEEETMAGELKDMQEEQLMKEYERQVCSYVEAEAAALGIQVSNVRVQTAWQEDVLVPVYISMKAALKENQKRLEEITIADIIIEEKKGESTKEFAQLQKILAQYYGIEESQVQIE